MLIRRTTRIVGLLLGAYLVGSLAAAVFLAEVVAHPPRLPVYDA